MGERIVAELNKIYPVLPLRNTVLFPNQIIPIYIGRKQSLQLISDVNELEDKTIVVVAQKDGSVELPKEKDFYDRYIATCYLKKTDINSWMVRNGFAIAYRKYSKKYVMDEENAKKNKLGLWMGHFISPEKWRKQNK